MKFGKYEAKDRQKQYTQLKYTFKGGVTKRFHFYPLL